MRTTMWTSLTILVLAKTGLGDWSSNLQPDDECVGEEACAVNALQLRGEGSVNASDALNNGANGHTLGAGDMKCLACTSLWSAYDPRHNGKYNLDSPKEVVKKCSCSSLEMLSKEDALCSACLTLWSGYDPRSSGENNMDSDVKILGQCTNACGTTLMSEGDKKCLACTSMWSSYDPRGQNNLDDVDKIMQKCGSCSSGGNLLTKKDAKCFACLTMWTTYDPRNGGNNNIDSPQKVLEKCAFACAS